MVTKTEKAQADETAADEEQETEEAGESVVDTVRKVVGEVLGDLFDSGKANVTDTSEGTEKPSRSLTLRDVEETAARMIREAQDAIPKPKKQAPAKTEAPKKEPETAPAKPNRLRSFLWGGDE